MSRRPAEPDPDDLTEVEDVEIRTIVYDDVDGDVVERRQLPAPKPAAPVRRELGTAAREPAREPATSLRDRESGLREQQVGLRRVVAATVPAVEKDAVGIARRPQSAAAADPAKIAAAAGAPAAAEPQPSRPMPAARRTSAAVDAPIENGVVCPFCAHVRAPDDEACPRCTMADTPSTRRSTGERIGPWFVLQRKNPTAPGLRFSVILALARRGHVTAKSIVRGPTTGQLWRYAGEIKGLSRLFGICWHCRAGVSPDATTCPKCKSAQEVPDDPDAFLENHAAVTAAGMADDPMAPAAAILPRAEPEPAQRPTRQPARPEPVVAEERPLAVERPAPAPRPPHRPAAARGIDPMLSASELAAVFQMPPSQPPRVGTLRRTARGAGRALRVAAVAAVVVGVAGAIIFAVKPEWRAPTQNAVGPYWTATRDRAENAAIVANNWAHDAWRSTTAAAARWRNKDAETAPIDSIDTSTSTSTEIATPRDPAGRAGPPTEIGGVPQSTPIRADPVATVATSPPPGRSSVVDAAPSPARADPRVAPAGAIPPEQSWDAILGASAARNATTKPADVAKVDAAKVAAARTGAAPSDARAPSNGAARANVTDAPSPAAEGASPSAADADRAAQMEAAINAALRDADRVLADAQKTGRPSPLPGAAATPPPVPNRQPPQAQQPQQPAQPPTAAAGSSQPPASMTLDQAMSLASTLRQTAIDAEARRDWAAALKSWQEIEKLPDAARPSDLKVRLSIARDRVNNRR